MSAPRDADPKPEVLAAELERALLRELVVEYQGINQIKFGSRLSRPVLAIASRATLHGQWVRAVRTIELGRKLVLEAPWPDVIGVLEHEMAHQFVDEILGGVHEPPHGDVFQRVCADRGIDPRAAGAPVATTSPVEVDRVLDRIRKLLALAGSSNQHEAELAMRKAHELMLRHNIEVTTAQATAGYEVRYLGDPAKRVSRVESDIVVLLAEFFFVKVIRVPVYLPRTGKRGSLFEIVGTRPNVEMAAHVYAFLLATAERLWKENRTDKRVRSGRDRLAYQAGVVRGFREKLGTERTELRGTGLVWVGDAGLDRYYRARHPRITTRTRQVRVNAAHAAGREAGRTVVLHRPVEGGPSGGGPRLLGK